MSSCVTIWIWLCAYLNCAGWTLSALHQLNAGGYAVALALGLVALLVWKQKSGAPLFPKIQSQKFRRRFRRGFPLGFLILAALAFLGGALHPPSNYDALSYRLPRMLHWLAAEQWHWIHTVFPRLNQRCCGIEWVSAPVLALLKSDRPLFLINFISFLFLPGLVFSVFTRLGVRPRVAWHWMWLAPTGYGFLLQAASIGNDLFGAVFVLAALDFALRAKVSGSARDFFTAVLAAALMTSAKPSNLPLLLPWSLAMLPSLPLLRRWPVRSAVIALIAAAASFLPSAVLNWHFCHDWTGMKIEGGEGAPAPVFLTGVNGFLLTLQNLNPPFFPFNGWWHEFFAHHLPANLAARLDQTMELGLRTFDLDLLPMEEHAGLGFSVLVLLLVSMAAGWRLKSKFTASSPSLWLIAVRWSPVISLLVILTQSRYAALAREVTPYYLPLLPLWLTGAAPAQIVRQRWWRGCAGLVFGIAGLLLVVSPARPLFPMQRLLDSPVISERTRTVYSVYRDRNDAFAPVRALLPPNLAVLGLVVYDDPEASLWRPFGGLLVEHICPADTLADLQARKIQYVLLNEARLQAWFQAGLADWQSRMHAELVGKVNLQLRASAGPVEWVILKLPPAKPDSPNQLESR
jgi:hypothetical protein